MFRQQVALRGMLGDPWPTMVLEPGATGVDDRAALVASMQEVGRLGSSSLTRTNEAHRELAEQALISAAASADALSSILQPTSSGSQPKPPSPHHPGGGQQHSATGTQPRTPPSPALEDRTRKMRKVAPSEGETEGDLPQSNSNVPLTAMERRLMEAYRFPFPDPIERPQQQQPLQEHEQGQEQRQHSTPAGTSGQPQATSGPSSQKEPLNTWKEDDSWGGSAAEQSLRQFAYQSVQPVPPQCSVILDGGSSIEPFNPSRVLPASSSPSAGGGSGHWSQPKMPGMKFVREADETLADGTGAIARGGNRIPHASVFGTYRHLKEDEGVPGVVRETINY